MRVYAQTRSNPSSVHVLSRHAAELTPTPVTEEASLLPRPSTADMLLQCNSSRERPTYSFLIQFFLCQHAPAFQFSSHFFASSLDRFLRDVHASLQVPNCRCFQYAHSLKPASSQHTNHVCRSNSLLMQPCNLQLASSQKHNKRKFSVDPIEQSSAEAG